jgi:pyruvate kinase
MPASRATKIVATVGPAADSPAAIRQLLLAGADVFRINASHSALEQHAIRISTIRAAADELGSHAAILLDLQGPKIRLGSFQRGAETLETGARFTITTQPAEGTASLASCTYPELARDVHPGDRILLADGDVELRVLETDGVSAVTQVVSGGRIGDHKGINLPGVSVSAPSLTEKDIAALEFGISHAVDFVALSFVRSADDVRCLRQHLAQRNSNLPVISKIEKPEAWSNLDEILAVSDGVMVARGDLGVEMALEKVPAMQKAIIEKARRQGRYVITATQMLESMIERPAPTRAEVSDVANAVYDGTDAVMLSGETAVGAFPVEAVRRMAAIAVEAERDVRERGFLAPLETPCRDHANIIAEAAYHAARSAGVAAIAVFTMSGAAALLVAKYHPPVPVFAFTPHASTARRLSLSYGVIPMLSPEVRSTDEILGRVDGALLGPGGLQRGDSAIIVAGQPVGVSGSTNLIKLHRLGAQYFSSNPPASLE